MTDKKITKRDNYAAIIAILGDTNPALVDFCNHEIELLDKKAATAKATAAKKKADGDAITDAVKAVLTDELTTIADITAKIGDENVTTAKTQFRLNALVTNGYAVKEQVTVDGGEGSKARKLMAYRKSN